VIPRRPSALHVTLNGLSALVIAVYVGYPQSFPRRAFTRAWVSAVQHWTLATSHDELTTGLAIGTDSTAPKVVAFIDYECPFCVEQDGVLDSLAHEGHILMIVQHYPNPALHQGAVAAAKAVHCATAVGKGETAHRQLMQSHETLAYADWVAFSNRLRINATEFLACMADSSTSAAIQRTISLGRRLNVRVTPTLLVGGRLLEGTVSASALRTVVSNAHP
jgi:protein-disulfide isomerase